MFLYTYLVKHMVTKKYGHIHINEIQKKKKKRGFQRCLGRSSLQLNSSNG